MDSTQELEAWHRPDWHPDHGDPGIEMGHLRSFAVKLLSAVPTATLTLETPEPGLLYVRVELASGTVAEVYSVPSPEDATHRRFAIFLCPGTAAESEIYVEAAEDASTCSPCCRPRYETGQHSCRGKRFRDTERDRDGWHPWVSPMWRRQG